MSGGSFCVVDRFWQQWYYGFIDIIFQTNFGLSKGEIQMAFESDYAKKEASLS